MEKVLTRAQRRLALSAAYVAAVAAPVIAVVSKADQEAATEADRTNAYWAEVAKRNIVTDSKAKLEAIEERARIAAHVAAYELMILRSRVGIMDLGEWLE